MKNKNLYIGLSVAAFVGIAYYMWSKKDKVMDSTDLEKDKSSEDIESKDEIKSNIVNSNEKPIVVIDRDANCLATYLKQGFSAEDAQLLCMDSMKSSRAIKSSINPYIKK